VRVRARACGRALRAAGGAQLRRLASLCYHVMKDHEIRRALSELGLPCHFRRAELVALHKCARAPAPAAPAPASPSPAPAPREYVLAHNAQCDAREPLPPRAIAERVAREFLARFTRAPPPPLPRRAREDSDAADAAAKRARPAPDAEVIVLDGDDEADAFESRPPPAAAAAAASSAPAAAPGDAALSDELRAEAARVAALPASHFDALIFQLRRQRFQRRAAPAPAH
jgi:hypothetical protein